MAGGHDVGDFFQPTYSVRQLLDDRDINKFTITYLYWRFVINNLVLFGSLRRMEYYHFKPFNI